MTIDMGVLGPSVLGPSGRRRGSLSGSHFVQLYDDDASLVEAVATFMSLGLERGDAGIVVADRSHRAAFEEALAAAGVDMGASRSDGRFQSLDASELLSTFMSGGIPDSGKFEESIGALVERGGEAGRKVRVFGEMVALLWAEGNVAGAITVEELWNDLAETHPFELFCAYPVHAFDGDSLIPLREVCRQHTHVFPPAR